MGHHPLFVRLLSCFVTQLINPSLFNIPRCLLTLLHLDPVDALHLQSDDLVLHLVPALSPSAGPHLLCAQAPGPLSGEQGGVRQVPAGGSNVIWLGQNSRLCDIN